MLILTMRKHCWLKLWLMYVASIARLRGELKELPSSCGGSLAVSLTVSRSKRCRCYSVQCESNSSVKHLFVEAARRDSPKSELSLLSKNSLLPTLCTMMSQELTERVQHIKVAKMASVANTLP